MGAAAAAAQWIAIGAAGPDEQVGAVRLRRVRAQHEDRELARWYQAADLYVHPARAEAFGLMIVEALACGTPVIASDVGGIPELIDAGEVTGRATGAIVPAGDARALAGRVTAFLARSPSERDALAANAAHHAASRFDRRRHEREYLDWIRELGVRSARPPAHDHPGGA